MKFVLAGQPNSGKSTIFNAVAGYRSATANFPGSSVSYTVSRALIQGREVDVVDLPGVYSLTSSDTVAGEGESYLLDGGYDLIIDVVDASRLGRSLELTLQLLELQRPMIVALNMVDEAERRGISVDVSGLERELGVPVVATIARRGKGLRELFRTALRHAHVGGPAPARRLDREVEHALATVSSALQESGVKTGVPLRFAATKLIEDDRHFHGIVLGWYPGLEAAVAVAVSDLERAHGWSADQIVSGGRHAVAHSIEEQVSVHGSPSVGWREWLDRLLLGPWTGGLLMVAILTTLFWGVFGVGRRIEGPLVQLFEHVNAAVVGRLEPGSLLATVADGIVMGLAGGVAIVLPYLIPFLLGLAILEDTGYLPRLAYILDSLMHRIGLHGKSVLPLILGYGCSVPAIMSTRILESKRDRRITGALAAFIPCSARSVVIFGDPEALVRELIHRVSKSERTLDEERAQAIASKRDLLLDLVSLADDVGTLVERYGVSSNAREAAIIRSVVALGKRLFEMLRQQGVQPVNAIGELLDPQTSDVVGSETREGMSAGRVLREVQVGYTWPYGLLRRARVLVSAGTGGAEAEATTLSEMVDKTIPDVADSESAASSASGDEAVLSGADESQR